MKSIGEVIKEHRLKEGYTQEELGKKLFVTKQAVSKWENGRTYPDIEMIRRIAETLNIENDEILGGSVSETKKSKKIVKILIPVLILSFLLAAFFASGGLGAIERRMQSGIAVLTVYREGKIVVTSQYTVDTELPFNKSEYGYVFDIDYGEVDGLLTMNDGIEIKYGFINANNWHNIQIRIDISENGDSVIVRQTAVWKSDGDIIEYSYTEDAVSDGKADVFREGD